MCGLRTIPSETGETGEHGKLCMLQRFKLQRGMCEPCARSLKVSGILMQARCVVATTVLPYSCGVGSALLHPGRHLELGEGTMSVAHVPSGAVLSQWRASAVEAVSAPTMALYCS